MTLRPRKSVFEEHDMADDAGKSRLGRGLAALIGDVGDETPTIDRERARAGQKRVPVEFIKPNPRNPRRTFTETELEELASSIREHGIIQPVLVRAERNRSDSYEIIAGERRWRAAQRANLHDVPVIVVEANDHEALQLAIIENVQRADLNAIEEASGYAALAEEFHYSHDDIAKTVGKSRSHIANTLRLMKLPEPVQAMVRGGQLSAGHARQLIGQPDAEALAKDIVARGLNVRQAEEMRQTAAHPDRKPRAATTPRDPNTVALERRMTDALGLTVNVKHRAGGSGVLQVRYKDLDQLEDVIRRLERD